MSNSSGAAGEQMKPHDFEILILDGACGSNLQTADIPASAWGANEGCNEYLNISAPEVVVALHQSFLDAGARVIETNTFGGSRIVLEEYGLAGETARINAAAVENARRAIGNRKDAFVAGSVGPTTRLPGLGQIAPGILRDVFREQVRALVEAGADLVCLETCQDLLQARMALVGCFEALEEAGRDVPVLVSITIESTGTMLTGADIAAAAAAVEPFDVFSLGLNCATGPELMLSHLRFLSRNWPGRISCVPNAGIPEIKEGKGVYPLSPDEFAARMKAFVEEEGVSIVGGCCGTTPEHIRCLAQALEGARPAVRKPEWKPSLSSGYQAVEIRQEIPPLLIGERANANGSKKFRKLLLRDDFEAAVKVGVDQEKKGAHAVDLCTAYAGRDEMADLTALTGLFAGSVKAPLVIDSTTPDCIEACLELYPGRCVINSINLEDGGKTLERICRLAGKHGAAVVALTINEDGMARTADEKVATARAILDLAVGRYGLRPSDLLIDPLTFTIGSGDADLVDAGKETLEALRRIKEELPGVFTLLGVSNISFGLEKRSRQFLNSVFLHEAVAAGLDAAIIDAGKVVPFSRIPEEDREICLDLIHNRAVEEGKTPLLRFIDYFAGQTGDDGLAAEEGGEDEAIPEQALTEKVVAGDRDGVDDILAILLQRRTAASIINEILVPAMRHVGEMFGRGEMLLPFVLQSAEVMKRSVNALEPFLEKTSDDTRSTVLLATVQGDVHDIGKNLVDIILSNNGYEVKNLGIKVPAETIIEKAKEEKADVIGLSGLLVKSALVMQENMAQFQAAGLKIPVLLGGAALTTRFVAESCVPPYESPVVYCADAFAGLEAMRRFEAGTLESTRTAAGKGRAKRKPGPRDRSIARDDPVPKPPFLGARWVEEIDPSLLFPFINEQALFRGRWGYRRGKMSADEYRDLIEGKVRPLYEKLKGRMIEHGLVRPKVAYGYFPCRSEGDVLQVEHDGRELAFPFPRQAEPPNLCIADFFKTREEGGDVAAFFVVTLGSESGEAARKLFDENEYHDYLMMHALSVELTDALAEYWHERMRDELGIGTQRPADSLGYAEQGYQGSRYGFGYPACPDLEAHETVFELLTPHRIGVTLTENMEMVPEQTTSALVAHHRQAKYFAV